MFESTSVGVMILVVLAFFVVDFIVVASVAFTLVLSFNVVVIVCFSLDEVVGCESVKKVV